MNIYFKHIGEFNWFRYFYSKNALEHKFCFRVLWFQIIFSVDKDTTMEQK